MMSDSAPKLSDWQRLLAGNAPWAFLAEVLVRFVLVYALLAVLMRLLGKRMSGQLSNVELAVMLLLGAIAGAPLTVPERGIIPGVFLLSLLLALHRGSNWLGARSAKVEALTQGRPVLLLKDGRLIRKELEQSGISNEQLFSGLRAKQVTQLGELKRLYFEAHGAYSLIRAEPPKPGLTVEPASDLALQDSLPRVPGLYACARCGYVERVKEGSACPECSSEDWSGAIAPPSDDSPQKAR